MGDGFLVPDAADRSQRRHELGALVRVPGEDADSGYMNGTLFGGACGQYRDGDGGRDQFSSESGQYLVPLSRAETFQPFWVRTNTARPC